MKLHTQFLIFSISLFTFLTLTLTGIDHIIHATLYEYGLVFSEAWAQPYWVMYWLAFQGVAVGCAAISRSWWLLIFYEAFTLTATQDLIFYAIWGRGIFPSGDWTWMTAYRLFGHWGTSEQFFLSGAALAAASMAYAAFKVYDAEKKS